MNYLTDFDWRTAPTKIRNKNLYFYAPEHPLAWPRPDSELYGWVHLARHVASVSQGKWLTKYEIVCFKDRNPLNIDTENLQIKIWGEKKVELVCPVCQKTFVVSLSKSKYRVTDSLVCAALLRRKFNYSADELWHLMWKYSQRQMVKMFGRKAITIQSRCKTLGILHHLPGYWRLIQLG